MPSIFDVLKADHDEHRRMLATICATLGQERADAFEAFRVEVSAHAAAEEQSLYAAMLGDAETQDDARHSVAEHKEVDDLLGELQGLDPHDSEWLPRFEKLRHRYEHHIEEEEDEMFPAAEEHFSGGKAEELGAKFDRRKPAQLEVAEASESGGERE